MLGGGLILEARNKIIVCSLACLFICSCSQNKSSRELNVKLSLLTLFQARYAALAEGSGSGSNTELFTVRLGQKNYLDVIERAITAGDTVLLENIDESVDPVLDPVIGRNTIKKGRAVRLGDREVEYNPKFRLILHTKLANPHYKV